MDSISAIRLLIADPSGADQDFSDAQVQEFLDLNAFYSGNDLLLMAAAMGCEAKAALLAGQASSVKIGDYTEQFKQNDTSLQAQADRYRKIVTDTPAFATVEENLSDMSALQIIRNFVLRTEP